MNWNPVLPSVHLWTLAVSFFVANIITDGLKRLALHLKRKRECRKITAELRRQLADMPYRHTTDTEEGYK